MRELRVGTSVCIRFVGCVVCLYPQIKKKAIAWTKLQESKANPAAAL